MMRTLLALAAVSLAFAAPAAAQNITAPVKAVVPAGIKVDTIKVPGPSLAGNLEGNATAREVKVILPPSYGKNKKRRYPVVYYLHGFAIDGRNFYNFMKVPEAVAKNAAEERGFDDALMLDWRGQIAESTGANVFFVKDGTLHTPAADCFLDGITRRTIIDLARASGMEVVERAIFPEEMAGFDEMFLTGSAAEVAPVREAGAYRFALGPVARQLRADYLDLVNGRSGALESRAA